MLSNEQLIEMYKMSMEDDFVQVADYTKYARVKFVERFLESTGQNAFDITQNTIKKYIKDLKREDGLEMNVDTKQNHLSAIKTFYNFLFSSDEPEVVAMRFHHLENGQVIPKSDPSIGIKSVNSTKMALATKTRKEGLTKAEADELLEIVRKTIISPSSTERVKFIATRDYAIFLMMFSIGLRISDVSNIKKTDMDLENKQLHVLIQKTTVPAVFPLSDILVAAIKEYNKMRYDKSEYIFAKTNGNKIDDREINNRLKYYASKMENAKKITCHTLRHTCGSLLYNNTHDPFFVKEVLKHGSITTTQRYIYSEDLYNGMAEKLENNIMQLNV